MACLLFLKLLIDHELDHVLRLAARRRHDAILGQVKELDLRRQVLDDVSGTLGRQTVVFQVDALLGRILQSSANCLGLKVANRAVLDGDLARIAFVLDDGGCWLRHNWELCGLLHVSDLVVVVAMVQLVALVEGAEPFIVSFDRGQTNRLLALNIVVKTHTLVIVD